MSQPYRLTKQCMVTFFPSRTFGAMRMKFAGSARSCMMISVGLMPIGQNHSPALRPNAARGGFQQAHDPQTHAAVADRGLAAADALGKVSRHRLQRFARIDMRAPDITRAITDHEPLPFLSIRAHVDAAVVHLDRLGGIPFVEDQALARAGVD